MKLEEIKELWLEDCTWDKKDPGSAAHNLPRVHAKYMNLWSDEYRILKKLEQDKEILYKDLKEYYNGTLSQDDLKALGWEPFQKIIQIKSDIQLYINTDPNWVKLNLKIVEQSTKVEYINIVLKQLSQISYNIHNYIEWYKYTNIPG